MGIISPTDKGLLINIYEVKLPGDILVKHLSTTKLQMHINNDNSANIGNSYSDPQAITLANGDVVVIAKNLKDKTLVCWYLKSDKNGKFKALAGSDGITERKLLKLSNIGNQFVLNGNTLLYSQIDKKIVGNQAVKITDFFTSNMAGVFKSLKKGKGINEYLLGNKDGQINEKSFFSSKHEISFLQYVERGEADIIAFLEKDKSSNKQKLSLTIFKDRTLLAYDTSIYEFEDSIEQLYVKDNGQGDAIVTAISGGNIITFIQKSSEMPSKATVIPASSITSLSDFVHIVNGELMPDITSTVTPITVTETVVTSEPTSPASIPANSSQPSSIATDKGYSNSTELTPPNSTTELSTTSTNAPTTSGRTTVLTIQSTTISPENQTAPTPLSPQSSSSPKPHELSSENPIAPTTPLLPQSSFSPKLDELSSAGAGGPNTELTAGIATGAFLGVMSLVGIIFGVRKCVQNYRLKNAAPSDVEASSAQTDNVSYGEYRVSELDYVEAEEESPGLLPSMFSRVSSWFGRNKPNVDVTLLENPVSNGRRSRSHNLGSYNTHYKSPNVDIEHNPVSNVRRSSDSNDSNQSNYRSIYEPPVKSNAMPLQGVLERNQFDTPLDVVSVEGRSSSELPGGSGRSSPRI